jgi:hypothetical protein
MKTGGSRGIAPCILNFGTRWGEWSVSRSGRFTPPGEEPQVPVEVRGWVGHGAGLEVVVKRRIPSACMESNPGCPALSLFTILTELRLCIVTLKQILAVFLSISQY